MSVRAYRIIKKEIAEESSFNLWYDDALIDFLKDYNPDGYNEFLSESGNGTIEISVSCLKHALENFKWEKDDYRISAIKADIAYAKKNDHDYIVYECF